MDPQDKDYFRAIVRIALNEYKIPLDVLRNEFNVSKGTLERWRDGRYCPATQMRPLIIDRIILVIEKGGDAP